MLSFYWKQQVCKTRNTLKNFGLLEIKKELDLKAIRVARENVEMYLNHNDEGLSAQLFAYGFREPMNCFLLSQFIKKDNFDVVIDVGSNIGYFPIIELASGAKKVISIEPVPETFRFLQKNMQRYPNVTTLNLAVSDKNKQEILFIPTQRNLASIIPDKKYLEHAKTSIIDKITIQASTLQAVIDHVNINGCKALLRMDIEGYERVIGYNLPEEIKAISLEFHRPVIGYKSSQKLLNHWEECGFHTLMLSREISGLIPLIKRFGIHPVLRMYELINKRLFVNPNKNTIDHVLRLNKESPHIFLKRQ
jgi:FkbM family methyltransferase